MGQAPKVSMLNTSQTSQEYLYWKNPDENTLLEKWKLWIEWNFFSL
jgi:hypothetical protein